MNALKVLDRSLRRWVVSVVHEFRRTRRVIAAPEQALGCESPIFVAGVHRSGTTLLRLMLDSHSRIACPPESFFLLQLASVPDDEKAMEGLTAMGFEESHVLQRLRDTAAYFFETYAAVQQKPRWADKTPSYVDCLPFIDSLFGPGCQYVVMYRHGLDVACSITGIPIREVQPYYEACGGDKHAGAARYWSDQCEKLLEFQGRHSGRCFEMRYEDMTTSPDSSLRRMFEFLGETWEEQVLRYSDQKHDHWVGLQDAKAAESRKIEPRSGIWKKESRDRIERMVNEAGTMLEKLGYSVDAAS